MATKTTATALMGLVNDLTDVELLLLTQSEVRPELKKFLKELTVKLAPAMAAYTVVVNNARGNIANRLLYSFSIHH